MIGDDRVLEDGYLACPGIARGTLTPVKKIGRPPHRQRLDKVSESRSEVDTKLTPPEWRTVSRPQTNTLEGEGAAWTQEFKESFWSNRAGNAEHVDVVAGVHTWVDLKATW